MSSTFTESLKRRKTYKFYKYRTTHGWGRTGWKIIRIPLGWDSAKQFFDNMSAENSWSEQFRGIEYHRLKTPPKAWLEKEILDLRERAGDINELADDYCWILQEVENEPRKSTRKNR